MTSDVIPLVRLAREVGIQIVVVDSRQRPSSLRLFREADAVLLCAPREALGRIQFDERTKAVLMNHNLDRDQGAFSALTQVSVPYLDRLGPKRRQQRMIENVRATGVLISDEFARHIHGPVGLDIGAEIPAEIALSIMAEIFSVFLLKGLESNEPDQVWCTDITYIPLQTGFMYLVAVMDWWSRHVLAWEISNTMDSEFCVRAWERTLTAGNRVPDISSSDQGAQFTGDVFLEAVESAGTSVSMDGRGRWMDNRMIARLWRSVKYEDICLRDYADGRTNSPRAGQPRRFWAGSVRCFPGKIPRAQGHRRCLRRGASGCRVFPRQDRGHPRHRRQGGEWRNPRGATDRKAVG